ncbi:hypothetical protein [Acetobacter cerevisiae]|nr:hypothetical protein [Acetobacter cerevisiae]
MRTLLHEYIRGTLAVVLGVVPNSSLNAREFLSYEPSTVSVHGSIQDVPCIDSEGQRIAPECKVLRLEISRPVDIGGGTQIDMPVTNQKYFDIVLELKSIVAGSTGPEARVALSELVGKPVTAVGSLTYAPTTGTTKVRFVVKYIEKIIGK